MSKPGDQKSRSDGGNDQPGDQPESTKPEQAENKVAYHRAEHTDRDVGEDPHLTVGVHKNAGQPANQPTMPPMINENRKPIFDLLGEKRSSRDASARR